MQETNFIAQAFDREWYMQTYPDVGLAGVDPLQHFLDHGDAEGRRPCAWFDSVEYMSLYPDVARSGSTAAAHFFSAGLAEGRMPIKALSPPPGWDARDATPQARLRMILGLVQDAQLRAECPSLDSVIWYGVMRATLHRSAREVSA